MPPQPTDHASESDATVRVLDLTVGSVKVTDDARNVQGLLERYWRAFGKWRQRRASRTSLHDLSDRELKDIGVTREEIDHIAPQRAIDALRDSVRWRSVFP